MSCARKQIYLHVGTPKAGSSSIQHFLTANRSLLARNGTAVYTALADDPAECLRHPGVRDPAYAGRQGAAWVRELVRRIQTRPENRIILSEEQCWFSIVLPEKRSAFLNFIAQLNSVGDVTIVVYLRCQDRFFMSSYQEWLKHGWMKGQTCREALRTQDCRFLQYRENLEWLCSVIGKDRVRVRPFEPGQFAGGSLCCDFMHSVGLSLKDDLTGAAIAKNAGLSPFVTEILRCLSFFRHTRDELMVFRQAECLADPRCCRQPDEHAYLSPEERRNWLKQFEQGNRWVASTLLGRSDGVLFEENPPPESEPWTEYRLNRDEVKTFFSRASFLSRSQRRRMCRQVLSVCEGSLPQRLRVRTAFGRIFPARPSRQPDEFLNWLKKPLPSPPPGCGDQPLFSIIMPVFNRAREVVQSLKSIQLQEFTDFEVIVVDDASSDRTADAVARVMTSDPRIQLIRLDTNVGPGPARNVGIARARGTYIRICDSDDFYPPGALAALARCAAEGDADVIAGNMMVWNSDLRRVKGLPGPWEIVRRSRSSDLRELPELWAMVHFHRCAFRRTFLQKNGIAYPSMRRGEDPVYMAEVLTKADSFSLVPAPVYLFHERVRSHQYPPEHILDAISAHSRIRQIMCRAGYPDLAFFFDSFWSPFSLSFAHLNEDELLNVSRRLIRFSSDFPEELLTHPYLENPACDKTALYHDMLVAKNAAPEQVAELMRRGMFCAQEHLRLNELEQLRRKIRFLRHLLRPVRPCLLAARALTRRIAQRSSA